MRTHNANLEMNAIPARHLRANETSRHVMTCHDMSQICHMRHIIMTDDQTIKKIILLM